VRALLCFGRACLRSRLLSLGFLGSHITLRGGLVLLGFAFLLERLVPGDGPGRFLGPTLHVFYDAFDACLRPRLTRQNRHPLSFHSFHLAGLSPDSGIVRYPVIRGANAAGPAAGGAQVYP